jgi:hypothetical protein
MGRRLFCYSPVAAAARIAPHRLEAKPSMLAVRAIYVKRMLLKGAPGDGTDECRASAD